MDAAIAVAIVVHAKQLDDMALERLVLPCQALRPALVIVTASRKAKPIQQGFQRMLMLQDADQGCLLSV